MARLTSTVVLLLFPLSLWGQAQIKQAGVCARCHVVSALEWSISRHAKVGTNCQACHGPSQGHVTNERDEVKPDRIPHGAAIAGLCQVATLRDVPRRPRRRPARLATTCTRW